MWKSAAATSGTAALAPARATWQNFDCGIAAATFELAAHELGLGSVVLGIFEEEKLRELLELPEGMGVACLMPLGYPAEAPGAPKRKEVAELLTIK